MTEKFIRFAIVALLGLLGMVIGEQFGIWVQTKKLDVSHAASVCLAAAQATSTAKERARWAEVTHKLESNPLDESVNKDGELALNRLSAAHDIHVPLCPALLREFNDAMYKYSMRSRGST